MYTIKEELLKLPKFALKYAEHEEDFETSKQKYQIILQKLKECGIGVSDAHKELTEQLYAYNYAVISNIFGRRSVDYLCTDKHDVIKFEKQE